MNIDTAQEIDGGRVSSLAQQQPGKLKGGGGGDGRATVLRVGKIWGCGTPPEYVVKC